MGKPNKLLEPVELRDKFGHDLRISPDAADGTIDVYVDEGDMWAWFCGTPAQAREMARALDTMADAVEAAQVLTIDADEQGHIDPAAAADVAARVLKETSGE